VNRRGEHRVIGEGLVEIRLNGRPDDVAAVVDRLEAAGLTVWRSPGVYPDRGRDTVRTYVTVDLRGDEMT
jgi:hypothetical protein